MNEYQIRKATIQDVREIHALLMDCSKQGLLLPRSLTELYSHLRDFYVVADRQVGAIFGCCALSIAWDDLAEIRSLVVAPEIRNQGWGSRLAEACLSDAVTLGLFRVFTLTYQVEFFTKLGFEVANKDILPQKIWGDCLHCPKYPDYCDETAMLLEM